MFKIKFKIIEEYYILTKFKKNFKESFTPLHCGMDLKPWSDKVNVQIDFMIGIWFLWMCVWRFHRILGQKDETKTSDLMLVGLVFLAPLKCENVRKHLVTQKALSIIEQRNFSYTKSFLVCVYLLWKSGIICLEPGSIQQQMPPSLNY